MTVKNKSIDKTQSYLSKINKPEHLKELSLDELGILAEEIRLFLLDSVSKTGGHIASNLGVVELTLALHRILDTPKDKIVWDVGHQTYVHKILTGRKDLFSTLRQLDGIAGFPKTQESPYDSFNTGHSSTSISAALGMARVRDLKGEDYAVVAVIGDGALTGGMALEALNDAGNEKTNLLIILNDNGMSIAQNVGGLSRYLSRVRVRPLYYKTRESVQALVDSWPKTGKRFRKFLHRVKLAIKSMFVPAMFFEDLGLRYYGPIDGHNIKEMVDVFEQAKSIKGPVLVHITTVKGKGYKYAEKKPANYHGIAPFVIETGNPKKQGSKSYSKVFGTKLCELALNDENIIAITAAMTHGTGLSEFKDLFKKRFFDVGIAEQHAVALAAGLAIGGAKPVVAIYSTFLQRAYDQILHDVALQNLNVVFAIDRAGIVGDDGETHQGIYDISFLYTIPNMTILSPASPNELKYMLEYALTQHRGPIAIRYPRGSDIEFEGSEKPFELARGTLLKTGNHITLIGVGHMVGIALEAQLLLKEQGINCDVINPRSLLPVDDELILSSCKKTGRIFIIEDVIKTGGFGAYVLELVNNARIEAHVTILGLPGRGIEHGKREQIYKRYGLDAQGVVNAIMGENSCE